MNVVSADGTTTSTTTTTVVNSPPVDNTQTMIVVAAVVSAVVLLIILIVSWVVIRKMRSRCPIEPDAPEMSNIAIALKPNEQKPREEFDFHDKSAMPR